MRRKSARLPRARLPLPGRKTARPPDADWAAQRKAPRAGGCAGRSAGGEGGLAISGLAISGLAIGAARQTVRRSERDRQIAVMSLSLVSGRKIKATTKLMQATMIGYQRPE